MPVGGVLAIASTPAGNHVGAPAHSDGSAFVKRAVVSDVESSAMAHA